MSLEIKAVIPELLPIEFNYEELKKDITESMEKYQGLVYTDDTIKEAKADRAHLNKFSKAIGDERKKIKAHYLAPYNTLETQVKELLALVKEPLENIDSQVKGYEERKRAEKLEAINDFGNGFASDEFRSLVPLDGLFNDKWLTVACSLKKAKEELKAEIDRIAADLALIMEWEELYKSQSIDFYLHSGYDMSATMQEVNRLKKQEEARVEYEAKKEAERLQRIAAEKIEQEAIVEEPVVVQEPKVEVVVNAIQSVEPAPDVEEERVIVTLKFDMSQSQAKTLKAFLRVHEIKAEAV